MQSDVAAEHLAFECDGLSWDRGRPARTRSTYRAILTAKIVTAIVMFTSGCQNIFNKAEPASTASVLATGALLPSPRLIIGRILAVDQDHGFAFVELASDAPHGALNAGTELSVRTLDLRDTGRIEVSRYLRGRTLGTKIVAGQPSPGDEVVWLAP